MRRSARFAVLLSALALVPAGATSGDAAADGPIIVSPRCTDQPLVLDRPGEYCLDRIDIRGAYDTSALTLTGDLKRVSITRSRFGQVLAGQSNRATALLAQGASVGTLTAIDCEFYDAENQLLSTAEGTFGHVVLERCSFRVTESFLRQIAQRNPWRTSPPTTEFANIECLELIDVDFHNTAVIIHPSVRKVILRGHIGQVLVVDPDTQVIYLGDGQTPADVPSPLAI